MKLSTHTYYITPMKLNWNRNSLWQFSTSQTYKLQHIIMVMILTAYVFFVISMTTVNKEWPQALSLSTSSLLKLANYTMHRSETWYACVFLHSMMTINKKMASVTFPYEYFFTSQTFKPYNARRQNLVLMFIFAFPLQPSTNKASGHFCI